MWLDRFYSRVKLTEDRISELEKGPTGLTQSEQRRENRLKKKNEQSLSNQCNNSKKDLMFVLLEFQKKEECGIEEIF